LLHNIFRQKTYHTQCNRNNKQRRRNINNFQSSNRNGFEIWNPNPLFCQSLLQMVRFSEINEDHLDVSKPCGAKIHSCNCCVVCSKIVHLKPRYLPPKSKSLWSGFYAGPFKLILFVTIWGGCIFSTTRFKTSFQPFREVRPTKSGACWILCHIVKWLQS